MKKTIKFLIILITILLLYFVLFKVVEVDKVVMKKIYPLKYSEYVEKYAEENQIEKELIYAMIKAESNFKQDAVSGKKAYGLMQIIESTANEVAEELELEITKEELLNPETNICLGTKYFANLLKKYGNIELALTAYNAGIGNVDKWIANGTIKADGSNIENIPFKETNNYVRKILRNYKIYKNYI